MLKKALFAAPLLFLAVFFFFSSQTRAATVGASLPSITSGLVGYWTFDGKDLIQNATDRSGQGNNGNLTNFTSTTTIIGKVGQALKFDGVSNFISSATTPTTGIGSFTISAWIKTSSTGARRDIIDYGRGASVNNSGVFFFVNSSNQIGFDLTNVTGTNSNVTVTDNKWHHVLVTNTSGVVQIYIDAVASGASTSMTPNIQALNGFTIGRHLVNSANFFNGSIDDVRIYNRALSSQEVKLLYNQNQANTVAASVPSITSGLVGNWTFDGKDMLQNVTDRSGQGNSGFLTNFTATTTVTGKSGQAITFDGVNNKVVFGNVLGSVFTGNYTTCLWVNYTSTATNRRLIGKALYTDSNSPFGITVNFPSAGKISAYLGTNADVNSLVSTTANLNNGKWRFLCVQRNGNLQSIWVDGVLDATQSRATSPNTNTQQFTVGHDGSNLGVGTGQFPGSVDDVRVYNRVLSSQEIKLLYNQAQPVSAAASAPSITSGLVGYWTFDGKNLTQNVTDSSGQGNHGFLTNFTSTTTALGKVGQALSFDGAANSISLGTTLGNFDNTNPFTVSAWIRPTVLNGVNRPIIARISGSGSCLGWEFRITTSNTLRFILANDGQATARFSDSSALTANVWTHVVGVWDGTNATTYVNGVRNAAQTSIGTPTSLTGVRTLQIGNDSCSATFFKGLVDDARIYNRALTSQEVKLLYNAQK